MHWTLRSSLLMLSCVALLACGRMNEANDAASTVDAAIDPATAQAISATMEVIGVAASLGAPLAPDGAMLRTDLAPDAMAHTRTEHGFSGSSVVTPTTCATYAWSGLMASVTLAGCTLEATGLPVSGTVSVAVTTRPVTFTISVTALVVNGTTYDGHVTLTLGGTDTMPMPPSLDVDLTTTDGTTTMHLTATGLTVAATATSMTIDGSASITSGTTTTAITMTNLTWAMGQCLPSSGTAALTTGALTTTLGFSAATPTTGNVTVTIPPFPSSTQMVFTPCP